MNLASQPYIATFQNPFAAKRLVPGTMDYVVPLESELKPFVAVAAKRFLTTGVGQIVGPHGCGKTSLARAICDELRENFQAVRFVAVRNRRQIETVFEDIRQTGKAELLVVDGIERLSILHRRSLLSCGKASGGKRTNVLITSHRIHFGWPLIQELAPTREHFCKIAAQFGSSGLVEADFFEAFDFAGGDYRQALMRLYDVASSNLRD